jgi:UDP-glucuronate 4-epimerase
MKLSVVVTGAAGFIGSHLCDRLLLDGHRVAAIDNFDDFYSPDLKRANIESCLAHQGFTLYPYDICDTTAVDEVLSEARADVVVHLAARAGVRPSIEFPLLCQKVNGSGTLGMLEMARKHGIVRFVFASSSSVYGEREKMPFSEKDSVEVPISPYAATKRAGELMCHAYHHLYGINVTCLRLFTVYGPRQRPDLAIRKFAALMEEGREIPVFGDGTSSRDYTYVDDVLNGMMAAIHTPFPYEIINLGESRTVTLNELLSLLEDALGRKAALKRMPDQTGDVPRTCAEISKARRLLGYEPTTSIEEGIAQFVRWFRESRAGV